jgi:polysaccharide deacetylase 2 family uncharacterized protein YibQ
MKVPAFLARLTPSFPGSAFARLESANHVGLSAGAFAALSLATIAAIQMFGDPQAAHPRKVISLASSAGAPAFRAPLSDVMLDPSEVDAGVYDELGFGVEGGELTELDPTSIAAAAAPPARPLPKAPIAKLSKPGPKGPLPIIAADGTTPHSAYKRPFKAEGNKPRVGVVVGGLGFNARVTQSAIDELPADVTLSFVPYADNLQSWIDKARARGHEVMIELPMEPFDPDANDTGPQTLLAAGAAKDNVAKLENLLSRGAGYFAVSNYQGAKFAQSGAASAPVVRALRDRGLAFVSNGIGARAALGVEAARAGLPFAAADRVLDSQREAEAIDEQLLNLEGLAEQSGAALGTGFAFPVTVEQIKLWSAGLEERGVQLAPASAILDARAGRR